MGESKRTKAAAAMKRMLSPPVMNQSMLAERLGVSQQAVSSWVKGRALPEPERMAAIEEILGIPMRDWVVPAPPDSGSEPVDADDSAETSAVERDVPSSADRNSSAA